MAHIIPDGWQALTASGSAQRERHRWPFAPILQGRENADRNPALLPRLHCETAGQYDLLGNPLQGAGDIAIDSVHRFKGRSAPCVVFTEIDVAPGTKALDEAACRRLFVGATRATRATMKLVLVLSQRRAGTPGRRKHHLRPGPAQVRHRRADARSAQAQAQPQAATAAGSARC